MCVYAQHLRTNDYVHHQSCQSKTTLTQSSEHTSIFLEPSDKEKKLLAVKSYFILSSFGHFYANNSYKHSMKIIGLKTLSSRQNLSPKCRTVFTEDINNCY